MVCRRWRVWALMSLAGAISLAAGPGGLPYSANDMENAHGADAVKIREAILKAAPSGAAALATYGSNVATEFTRTNLGVNSKNPDARLNSAILIAQLQTISTDTALEDMLKSSDPSVRFWAAKGLADIAAGLKPVGGGAVGRAVSTLSAAVKTEKSGVVIQEIIQALSRFGDPAAIRTGLAAVVTQISANQLDVEMFHAAGAGLSALAPSVGSGTAAEKVDSASLAATLASLSAQQLVNYNNTLAAASQTLPKSALDATHAVVSAASQVADAATGKRYTAPAGSSPDEILFNVNSLFGTPGSGGGTLQKDLPGVATPPAVASSSAH